MSREKSNKNRGVQFTHESARQIAEVVRQASDTHRRQGGMPGGGNAQAAPHYLSKTTASWSRGSSQTLTIWSGTPGSEAAVSGQTVQAWNYVANLPSGLWVVLARGNGGFYLASFDYTGLSGYASASQQVLGHDSSGQLIWLNTTDCATA